MSRGRVVVLGDVMTDVIARVSAPPAVGSDTPAQIVMRPGGSAANTAAWLGHLGVDVAFVGCVGDDPAGREAERALATAGVAPRLAVDAAAATGACVVLVDAAGERTMFPDAGANARLPIAPLPPGDHLHLSGYALIRPRARAAAAAALRAAEAAGMTISIDAASAAPLAAMGPAAFRALARGRSLALVTLDEAEVLTGSRDPGAVTADLLADHDEVIVKLGPGGALWRSAGGGSARAEAVTPAAPLLDATGAGDAFTAGWLAARRAGEAPAEALGRACALAAVAVTRPGARPAG